MRGRPMAEPPRSIVEAFLGVAGRTPEKTCVVSEGDEISYARLRREALRWAGALRAWGLNARDRVALFLENGPDFIGAYLGTHLAGGIIVPVNTQYRQIELRHILTDAGVRLCVADPPGRAEPTRVAAELPALEAVVVADAS